MIDQHHDDNDEDRMEEEENDELMNDSQDEKNSDDEDAEMVRVVVVSDEQLDILQQRVAGNIYDYSSHVSLIQAFRQRANFEELRKARQTMLSVYPLSEVLWVQWLKDEIELLQEDDKESIQLVRDLFTTAFQQSEMMSKVWQLYLQFCSLYESEEITLQVLERSTKSIGYHMRLGFAFWDAYRDFVKDDEELVINLYKQQLAIPHLQFKQTKRSLEALKVNDKPAVNAILNEPQISMNRELLQKRKKVEKWIRSIPKDGTPSKNLLNHWLNYLSFEKKQLIESEKKEKYTSPGSKFVVALFERAVNECSLSDTLWVEYLKFLESRGDEFINELIPLCYRATRNCPWNSSLWVAYITFIEFSFAQSPDSHEELHRQITDVYTRAMQGGQMSNCNDFVQVLAAYCSYMNRRYRILSAQASDEIKTSLQNELRETYEQSIGYIYEYFKNNPDRVCVLEKMWAAAEAGLLNNVAKSREIYDHMMELYGDTEAALWLHYAQFEHSLSNTATVFVVYQRAFTKLEAVRAKKLIASFWLQYAREHGSIQELVFAEQFTRALMAHGSRTEVEQENNEANKKEDKKPNRSLKKEARPVAVNSKKPALIKTEPSPTKIESKEKLADSAKVQPAESVPSFNLSMPTAEQLALIQNEQPEISTENSNGAKKRSRQVYEKDQEGDPEEKKHKRPTKKSKLRGPGNEQLTLFVLNLSYKLDEYQLRKFFESKLCRVEDVRIMRDKRGVSKGMAYVEMVDDESVELGLQQHSTLLERRPIRVERSDPDRYKKQKEEREQHHQQEKQQETRTTEQSTESIQSASSEPQAKEGKRPKRQRLVPRATQLHKIGVEHTPSTTVTQKPMTNDDFKKLFSQ